MKIRETKEYILDLEEIRLVKNCLDYVGHRLTVHGKPKNINPEAVQKLREVLEKD